MKWFLFVTLGFAIFEIAFSKRFLDDWYDDDIFDDSRESSDTGFCTYIFELFGLLFDDDDDSEESDTAPAQLPGGPSWLQETMHPVRPQAPGNGPPNPGHHEKPPGSWVGQGQRPSPPKPFHPQQHEQQQKPKPQEPPILFNNSQSIPTSPPAQGIPIAVPSASSSSSSNYTATPEDSLIISTLQDLVDDTDGEGVLVGE